VSDRKNKSCAIHGGKVSTNPAKARENGRIGTTKRATWEDMSLNPCAERPNSHPRTAGTGKSGHGKNLPERSRYQAVVESGGRKPRE